MRHNKKGKSLGRKSEPRKALMRNLATNIIVYEKITTTLAKAKSVRPIVEKIITLSKNDTLANRRIALKRLYLQGAVKKLFEVIGPRYKNRKGGYSRIVKLERRLGDNAKMATIELVQEDTNEPIKENNTDKPAKSGKIKPKAIKNKTSKK